MVGLKKAFVYLLLLGGGFLLFPQDSTEENGDTISQEDDEKAKQEELLESLNTQKRDTLLYGIDSEVLDVISTIRSENDRTFDDDLAELLAVNDNPEINRAVFDFFSQTESEAGKEKALRLIDDHLNDYEFSTNLVLAAISYLGNIKAEEAGELFYDMLDDNNKSLAGAALRGIGKLEDSSRVEDIMDFFNANEGDSEYEDLLASAILVMGELGYKEAAPSLVDVFLDEDVPSVHRQYAAVSLGKLGTEEGYEVLKEQFALLEDSNLRAYVLKGLTEFDKSELEGILLTALRDSFWRIRVAACEGLGSRKVSKAVDILIYKVKNDPVRQVRYSALSALGEIEAEKGNTFLREQFESERNAFDLRTKALDLLLEKKIAGTIESLHTVLDPKWDKERDNELGPFCKILSSIEWADLEPFYRIMMDNNDFIIRIYGIRGIKINNLSTLSGRLKELDSEDEPVNVRREVKAALEVLEGESGMEEAP